MRQRTWSKRRVWTNLRRGNKRLANRLSALRGNGSIVTLGAGALAVIAVLIMALGGWRVSAGASPLPPLWLFAPMVYAMYMLMGLSAMVLRRSRHDGMGRVWICYGVMAGLALILCFVYYVLSHLLAAFVTGLVLSVFSLVTLWQASKIDRPAALLLLPGYLVGTYAAFSAYTFLL